MRKWLCAWHGTFCHCQAERGDSVLLILCCLSLLKTVVALLDPLRSVSSGCESPSGDSLSGCSLAASSSPDGLVLGAVGFAWTSPVLAAAGFCLTLLPGGALAEHSRAPLSFAGLLDVSGHASKLARH